LKPAILKPAMLKPVILKPAMLKPVILKPAIHVETCHTETRKHNNIFFTGKRSHQCDFQKGLVHKNEYKGCQKQRWPLHFFDTRLLNCIES
jgi:hypothetical protein